MKALVKLSRTISRTSHIGMKYGTKDYFKYHVTGVVQSLKNNKFGKEHIIVGYLHDVVEDTDVSLSTITNLFGTHIGQAVDAITKRKDEARSVYLKRCASNKIARIVKLHDALFNASNCSKNKNKEKYNYYLETIAALQAT